MARLTLEQIGALAGVSRSTVSRVINDHPEVSPEVKARVLAVIEETGYRPNRAARSLASSRSGVLALVVAGPMEQILTLPFTREMLRGALDAADEAEQTLSLFMFESEKQQERLYPRVIDTGLLDGLIVTATTIGDPLLDRLVVDRTPFVVVGSPDRDDVVSVDVDHAAGAREVTSHLLDHGVELLGTVAGPLDYTIFVQRLAGVHEAAAAAGVAVSSDRIVSGRVTEDTGYEGARALLGRGVDGIFLAADDMAPGALRALAEAGLQCPDDVLLGGFGGFLEPEGNHFLTTVVQRPREHGRAAVEMLVSMLGSPDRQITTRVLPAELRLGGSCGCVPATEG